MPRIHCLYMDCNFLEDNYCAAPRVEIDPDIGCVTYVPVGDEELLDDGWSEEDDEFDNWETEDVGDVDDDDDFAEDEDLGDEDW